MHALMTFRSTNGEAATKGKVTIFASQHTGNMDNRLIIPDTRASAKGGHQTKPQYTISLGGEPKTGEQEGRGENTKGTCEGSLGYGCSVGGMKPSRQPLTGPSSH